MGRFLTSHRSRKDTNMQLQNVILKLSMMREYCRFEAAHTDSLDVLSDLPDDSAFASFRDDLSPLVEEASLYQQDTVSHLGALMSHFGHAQGQVLSKSNWAGAAMIVDASLNAIAAYKQHYEHSIQKMTDALAKFNED